MGRGDRAFNGHPRYELYGTGTVFDSEATVRGFFEASHTPFPDQGNDIVHRLDAPFGQMSHPSILPQHWGLSRFSTTATMSNTELDCRVAFGSSQ
ncbi:MAG: hypothetical protein ABR601_03955 [Parasphingopyxis sp.]|nr:hypothetical protein [Sphingomonadales bacterium]